MHFFLIRRDIESYDDSIIRLSLYHNLDFRRFAHA